ncbi:MAG: 20S proteasome subunit A/B [Verrucomicrobiota bacterium]|nr:20S proteasome subunit A/B [Verrucomicrobiota bacterium]
MMEEPYRWVEAIATRRDYIETQLATGSAIVAVSCADGILLLTVGKQKLFEIYDRIALGAIGHPGDIERLRMAAIELASTEGFTRAAADVSLRRLAYYSLSPLLKNAFEQIYGAPFLARLLFAEIGATPAEDLFLCVEYDGSIAATDATTAHPGFAIIAGKRKSSEAMAAFLQREHRGKETLAKAIELALDAWIAGQLAEGSGELSRAELKKRREEFLKKNAPKAVLLERHSAAAIRYRALDLDSSTRT